MLPVPAAVCRLTYHLPTVLSFGWLCLALAAQHIALALFFPRRRLLGGFPM